MENFEVFLDYQENFETLLQFLKKFGVQTEESTLFIQLPDSQNEMAINNQETFQQFLENFGTLPIQVRKNQQSLVTIKLKTNNETFQVSKRANLHELRQSLGKYSTYKMEFQFEGSKMALDSQDDYEIFLVYQAREVVLSPGISSSTPSSKQQQIQTYQEEAKEIQQPQNYIQPKAYKQVNSQRNLPQENIPQENATVQEINIILSKLLKNQEDSMYKIERAITKDTSDEMIQTIFNENTLINAYSQKSLVSLFKEPLFLNLSTYQGFQEFFEEVNTFFRTMKRRQINDEFLKYAPFPLITYLSGLLRAYDSQSRTFLNQLLLQFYPTPIMYPILAQGELKYQLNEELVWALKDSYCCISLHLGKEATQKIGKSTLLNELFSLPIQKDPSNLSNDPYSRRIITIFQHQSITQVDTQITDQELEANLSWTFIDVPGLVSIKDAQRILNLGKILLVHITSKDFNEQKRTLANQLQVLRGYLLVIFVHCQNYQEPDFDVSSLKQNFTHIKVLPALKEEDGRYETAPLKKAFMKEFWQFPKASQFKYDLTKDAYTQKCSADIKHQMQLLQQFSSKLDQEYGINKGSQCFAFYPYYAKLQFINELKSLLTFQQVNKDSQASKEIDDSIFKLNEEYGLTLNLIKQQGITPLMKRFIEIFKNSNRNTLLGELSTILQKFNEKREQQKAKFQQLSVELFLRELLLIKVHYKGNSVEINAIQTSLSEYILSGEPFELVDGDNNVSLIQYYKEMLEQLEIENCFYLSILGPQSSGKSTLLKYTFGSHFKTSSGRCTKGVYASLQRLHLENQNQHVLLIDTEGIDSHERRQMQTLEKYHSLMKDYGIEGVILHDKYFHKSLNFDNVMTMYLFQLSDSIIINVKGELISEQMKNLLLLSFRGIIIMKLNSLPPPEIVIVLNQVANNAQNNVKNAINNMIESICNNNELKDLIYFSTGDVKISQQLLFSQENLKILPFAFKTERQVRKQQNPGLPFDFNFLKTEEQFGYQTQKLKVSIVDLLRKRKADHEYRTLKRWLNLSDKIWGQIIDQREIFIFKNLEELKEYSLIFNYEQKNEEKLEHESFYQQQDNLLSSLKKDYSNAIAAGERNLEVLEKKLFLKIERFYEEIEQKNVEELNDFIGKNKLHIDHIANEAKNRVVRRVLVAKSTIIKKLREHINQLKVRDYSQRLKDNLMTALSEILKQKNLQSIDPEKIFAEIYQQQYSSLLAEYQANLPKQIDSLLLVVDQVKSQINELTNSKKVRSHLEALQNKRLDQLVQERWNQLIMYSCYSPLSIFQIKLNKHYNLDKQFLHTPKRIGDKEEYKYFNLKMYFQLKETITSRIQAFILNDYKSKKYTPILDSQYSKYKQFFTFLSTAHMYKREQMLNNNQYNITYYISEFLNNESSAQKLLNEVQNIAQGISEVNQKNVSSKLQSILREIEIYNHELRQIDCELNYYFTQELIILSILIWADIHHKRNIQEHKMGQESLVKVKNEQFQNFQQKFKNILQFDKQSKSGNVDKQSSQQFTQSLISDLNKYFIDEAQTNYEMRSPKNSFKSKYGPDFVKRYLRALQLENNSGDAVYKFIMNPDKEIANHITSHYQKDYQTLERKIVEETKMMYQQFMGDLHRVFEMIVSNLKKEQFKQLTPYMIGINPEVTKDSGLVLSVFRQMLIAVLTSPQIPQSLNVEGHKIDLNQCRKYLPFGMTIKCVAPLQKFVIDRLLEIQIYDLLSFSEQVASKLGGEKSNKVNVQEKLEKVQLEEITEIIENCKICGAECPACRRQCDLQRNHSSQQKHKCSTGHFVMAFQGWRNASTRKATLTTCDINEYHGENFIYKNVYIPWPDWISHHQDWNFGSSSAEKTQNYQMMKTIWTRNDSEIGRKVCSQHGIIFHTDFPEMIPNHRRQ